MSEQTGSRTHHDPSPEYATGSRTAVSADHWGLVLTYGVLTFGIGPVLTVVLGIHAHTEPRLS
jgi:hypothetical protein